MKADDLERALQTMHDVLDPLDTRDWSAKAGALVIHT